MAATKEVLRHSTTDGLLMHAIPCFPCLIADYSYTHPSLSALPLQGSWAMAATKEVLPGQELFLSYGFGFWLHPVMHQHPRYRRVYIHIM